MTRCLRPKKFGYGDSAMSSRSRHHGSFEDRYVAFVDILGFRNIVARMEREQGLFSTVRDALKTIDEQAREFRNYRVARKKSHEALIASGQVPLTPPPQLQMTAFSDCYVISETAPAWRVLAGVQALGATLLAQGILCRGAVVRGAAYQLVTEKVRKAAWDYHKDRWKGRLFIQDTDGCWFINVLTPSMSVWKALPTTNEDVSSREFLQTVRKRLTRQLSEAQADLGRLSKLQWLGNHFNKLATERGKVDLLVFPEDGRD